MTALTRDLRTTREFIAWPVAVWYIALIGGSAPFWPFAWHLALHITGAAFLIGNAVVMAIWLSVAGFTGGDAAKRRATSAVNRGDVWFTVPGVLLLLLNGMAMVFERYGGPVALTTTSWAAAGLVLLSLTGLVWAVRLVPTQLQLYRLARVDGAIDATAFRQALIKWAVWGVLATAMPLVAAGLMIVKPTI